MLLLLLLLPCRRLQRRECFSDDGKKNQGSAGERTEWPSATGLWRRRRRWEVPVLNCCRSQPPASNDPFSGHRFCAGRLFMTCLPVYCGMMIYNSNNNASCKRSGSFNMVVIMLPSEHSNSHVNTYLLCRGGGWGSTSRAKCSIGKMELLSLVEWTFLVWCCSVYLFAF